MNVSAERVRQQIASILTAWGMDADLVLTTADAMLYSDLAGIDSHGISMLIIATSTAVDASANVA